MGAEGREIVKDGPCCWEYNRMLEPDPANPSAYLQCAPQRPDRETGYAPGCCPFQSSLAQSLTRPMALAEASERGCGTKCRAGRG